MPRQPGAGHGVQDSQPARGEAAQGALLPWNAATPGLKRRWRKCCDREVTILKEAAAAKKPNEALAIVSYDETPGVQAIATTAPDLPPEPSTYRTFARDHEYTRHGTISL